jgi:ketosteroid isomerase-like protein
VAWLAGRIELGFWLTEHDVIANDEHVCALSDMGVRRPGVDIQTRVVSIFHFRDGRQAERWFFPENALAWDQILDASS